MEKDYRLLHIGKYVVNMDNVAYGVRISESMYRLIFTVRGLEGSVSLDFLGQEGEIVESWLNHCSIDIVRRYRSLQDSKRMVESEKSK